MESVSFKELDVHEGERGWVSEIYSGKPDLTIKNIHYGSVEPSSVRGNHYHEKTNEWIAFMNSTVSVRWGSPETPDEKILQTPFRVKLPVEVPHAFKNVGEETVIFAAYTDQKYNDKKPDVTETILF